MLFGAEKTCEEHGVDLHMVGYEHDGPFEGPSPLRPLIWPKSGTQKPKP